MKKIFRLEGVDCGVCAAKIESKINKLKGVEEANFNLLLEKLVVEFKEEPTDELLAEIKKTCEKVEPDCELSDF